MTLSTTTRLLALIPLALCVAMPATAAVHPPQPTATVLADSDAMVTIPTFDSLAAGASKTVSVTLDSSMMSLGLPMLHMDDSASKEMLTGLKSLSVRDYQFDSDYKYPTSDMQAFTKQLTSAHWKQIVDVHENDKHVTMYQHDDTGLVIVAAQPKQFTVVGFYGHIDIKKLSGILKGAF